MELDLPRRTLVDSPSLGRGKQLLLGFCLDLNYWVRRHSQLAGYTHLQDIILLCVSNSVTLLSLGCSFFLFIVNKGDVVSATAVSALCFIEMAACLPLQDLASSLRTGYVFDDSRVLPDRLRTYSHQR